ncbi:hypothetical protein MASR1M6_08520 [Rubrivivax sp.]
MPASHRRHLDHLAFDQLDARVGREHTRLAHQVKLIDAQQVTLEEGLVEHVHDATSLRGHS